MLSLTEALESVLAQTAPLSPRETPLAEALGLTLAEDVASDVDSPPHDKALVDGYAVRTADFTAGVAELSILEEVTAGAVPSCEVTPGATSRVMTGAPLPAGADAMVMVEQAQLVPGGPTPLGRVRLTPPKMFAGMNLLRRAASMRRGDVVLTAGALLRPIEIGLLAEVGRASAPAIPRPRVAILSTGNELVPPDQLPAAGQIRNSNGPMLAAYAVRAGGVATELGIARDEAVELSAKIAAGLTHDVLILSGGVSAGVLDLVPGVLRELGVEEVFHKVTVKPGKPIWFGVLRDRSRAAAPPRLVFGLPGNPVGSLVTFELFVRPAIARLAGSKQLHLPRISAALTSPFTHRGERPTFHPGRLDTSSQPPRVEPLRWQGSADLRALAQATALIHFPPGDRQFEVGEMVDALVLS